MKYNEVSSLSFLLDKEHFVYKEVEENNSFHIYVKSRARERTCPNCKEKSRQLSSTYNRTLQDTPIHCKQTFIHLKAYKYKCNNPKCEAKVFTEELSFAKPSQVRTIALTSLILGVSMFLSNEGASNVLSLLGVRVSADTIKRIYDRIEYVDDVNVEEVGIDDVAIRKGQTYATAIYDMKDHHMIALLEGRDAETLKDWLKNHKKIKKVARDRASGYAKAISEILPDCIQIADRFHLLQNLIEYLKDIFYKDMPTEIFIKDGAIMDEKPKKIKKAIQIDKKILRVLEYDNEIPMDDNGNIVEYDNRKHDLNSKQYKEQAKSRKKNSN